MRLVHVRIGCRGFFILFACLAGIQTTIFMLPSSFASRPQRLDSVVRGLRHGNHIPEICGTLISSGTAVPPNSYFEHHNPDARVAFRYGLKSSCCGEVPSTTRKAKNETDNVRQSFAQGILSWATASQAPGLRSLHLVVFTGRASVFEQGCLRQPPEARSLQNRRKSDYV